MRGAGPARRSTVPLVLCSLVIAACGDDAGSTTSDADVATDAATTADLPEVDVAPDTIAPPPTITVTYDDACRGGAETQWDCGHAEVPLDWDDPEGDKIAMSFLRRLGRQPSRGQLWLLSGGPGGTAFGAKDAGDFLGAYLS
ncbi:MAG: hypothetical protein IT385_17390, partial [Deltaproteobacteria bacterium]|nr:hypothetical protein [Deltaproteobacteria bacterium]